MADSALEEVARTLGAETAAAVAACADPGGAARVLLRLHSAARDTAADGGTNLDLASLLEAPGTRALVVRLAAHSPSLSRSLARDPSGLASLSELPAFVAAPRPAPGVFEESLAALLDADLGHAPRRVAEELPALQAVLRRFRHREYRRLALRDLDGAPLEEVARELSWLAQACIDAAVRRLSAALEAERGPARAAGGTRCGFVVMGMGKLGGEELNFSSDVDLCFFYETDEGEGGQGKTLHEHFRRLAELVTRALDEMTADGLAFRVDLRLRPEGEGGPLVNSLASAERYYETWGRGRPWERQAWLKARPVAGDTGVGAELLARLEPFVYRRSTDETMLREVQALHVRTRHARARAAAGAGAGPALGFDTKLDAGGVRDIELFVQALQLLYAGKNRALRERGTLPALERLLYAGIVSAREHADLGDAYRFLRRLEHRIQMAEEHQTHRTPSEAAGFALLAARFGTEAGALGEVIARHRAAVRRVADTLLPPEGAPPPARASEAALMLATMSAGAAAGAGAAAAAASGSASASGSGAASASASGAASGAAETAAAVEAALRALGFQNPGDAAGDLAAMRRTPLSPFGPTALAPPEELAAPLLDAVAATPDPDLALRHLRAFVTGPGRQAGYATLLRDHPAVRQLLVTLFGTSDLFARQFIGHPELLDALLRADRAAAPRARADLVADLAVRMRGPSPAVLARSADRTEAACIAARRFRTEELLRIGLADVAGELPVAGVFGRLSDLAEACIAACLDLACAERPDAPPLCVVALGKLGGRSLGYAGDLDLLFLYDEQAASAPVAEAAARLAQRVLFFLNVPLEGGVLYEVDTRLRPDGAQGPLVSSLAGFAAYHADRAGAWERLALVRARPVAGPPDLRARVAQILDVATYRSPPFADTAAAAAQIAHLRGRIERELAREVPARGRYNVKTGRGGVLDLEFAVQFRQLLHGAERPELRVTETVEAIERLRRAGILEEEDATRARSAYDFLRRLESRIRIVQDRAQDELPVAPAALATLARRMGYGGGDARSPAAALLVDYRRVREEARALLELTLGPVPPPAAPAPAAGSGGAAPAAPAP